ncbi:hypothetical protein chiPu_0011148 [Chiloscyllium punctatum]|uniref:Uncharacterized protein n=1 Tax=Chiloscyllium punctatum TaxID=137246 RepID=A0A401SQL0_CHIPU|nr:hypothetical protein [Chiloscyllium punctatum]
MRVTPTGMDLRVSPSQGKYDLKIFAKPLDSEESYTCVCVCKLGIFVRPEGEEDFGHICVYVIRCCAEGSWPPFPRMYSLWKKGCVLYEPWSGVLPSDKWVQFRVCIPGAHRVFLVGQFTSELYLSKSHMWEGNVFTGPVRSQLKLAAKLDPSSPAVSVLSTFDVGDYFVQGP